MKVETRTYETPGECLKCSSMRHSVEWCSNRDLGMAIGDPSHRLYATCSVCTFFWSIKAKDECGEQERHHMSRKGIT